MGGLGFRQGCVAAPPYSRVYTGRQASPWARCAFWHLCLLAFAIGHPVIHATEDVPHEVEAAAQPTGGAPSWKGAFDAATLLAAVANASISSILLTADISLGAGPPGALALVPDIRNRSLSISGDGCLATLQRPCVLSAATGTRARLFLVAGGRLSLANITLVGGGAGESGAIAKVEAGGALECVRATLRGTAVADNGGLLHVAGPGSRLAARECTLEGGRAVDGGAIHLSGGASAYLGGCHLANNEVTGMGGGIVADGQGTELTCQGTSFLRNKAGGNGGAAVLSSGTKSSFTSSRFDGNHAASSAGALHVFGAGTLAVFANVTWDSNYAGEHGAAFVATLGANVTLVDARLVNHRALGFGGAAMARDPGTSITVRGGLFEGSRADWGGCFYLQFGASAALYDSVMVNSTSESAGGSISAVGAGTHVTLVRVSFIDSRSIIVAGTLHAITGVEMVLEDVTIQGSRASSHGACTHYSGTTFIARNVTADGIQAVTNGGCFYFMNCAAVHLSDVTVTNALAGKQGGAFYAETCANVTITRARMSRNTAGEWGGAIGLANNGAVTITDALVTDNTSPDGGAVYVSGGQVLLQRSSFLRNRVSGLGGFLAAVGGAAVQVQDGDVRQHMAAQGGGCIHVAGSGTRVWVGGAASVCECMAPEGGALLVLSGASATVDEDASLLNNTAARAGGAISARGPGSLVALQGRALVAENVAIEAGGCGGGVALAEGAAGRITGSVRVASNVAAFGGAVCVRGNGTKLTMEAGAEPPGVGGDASVPPRALMSNNSARWDGGAVFMEGGGTAALTGRFWANVAGRDGGAIATGQPLQVTGGSDTPSSQSDVVVMRAVGVDMRDNVASGSGGAVFLAGDVGGQLQDSTLHGNEAGVDGAGLYVEGEGTRVVVTNTTLGGHQAQRNGGAISLLLGARATLSNVLVAGNGAGGHGGGVFASGSSRVLATACSLRWNSATLTGGALFLTGGGTRAWLPGGVVGSNAALHGGGVYLEQGARMLAEGGEWADNVARSGWGGAVVALGVGAAFGCDGCSLSVAGAPLLLASPGKELLSKGADACVVSAATVGTPLVPGGSSAGQDNATWDALGARLALLVEQKKAQAGEGGSGGALRTYGCSEISGIDVEVADFAALSAAVADPFVGTLRLTSDVMFSTPVAINRTLQVIGTCQGQQWLASNKVIATSAALPASDEDLSLMCHVRPATPSTPLFLVAAGGSLLLQDLWVTSTGADASGGNNGNGDSNSSSGGSSNVTSSHSALDDDGDSGLVRVRKGGALMARRVTFAGISINSCSAVHLSGSCRASFDDCAFVGNKASLQGGALCATAGANLTVSSSVAEGNEAAAGGFLYASGNGTLVTLVDTLLLNNSATGYGGGAIHLIGASLMRAHGGLFAGNVAVGGHGGAAYVVGPGTGLSLDAGCALEENVAQQGGGVFVGAGASLAASGAAFASNVALEAGGAVTVTGPSRALITDAHFDNNMADVAGGALSLLQGGACLAGPRVAFVQNRANKSGGAVDVSDTGSQLSCIGCNFVDNAAAMRGGGVCALRGATVSVTLSSASNNTAGKLGGTFYGEDGGTSLNITRVRVEGGRAGTAGGGVYLISSSRASVQECDFVGGSALFGGGLALEGAGTSMVCVDSLFEGHVADRLGGVAFLTAGATCTFLRAVYSGNRVGELGRGGVGFAQNVGTSVTSQGCVHRGNAAGRAGGAWFLLGGASMASEADTFDSNSAGQGGAVYALEYATRFVAERSTFTNNTANGDGGALHLSSVSYTALLQCALRYNHAGSKGGAVYWGEGSTSGISRGNLFEGNEARGGGAIALMAGGELQESVGDVFEDNHADVQGGAVLVAGGAVAHFLPMSLQGSTAKAWVGAPLDAAPGCLFARNRAPLGGALYVNCEGIPAGALATSPPLLPSGTEGDGPPPTTCVSLDRCGFVNNTALGGCGGAIWSSTQRGVAVTCADASNLTSGFVNTNSSSSNSSEPRSDSNNNSSGGSITNSTDIDAESHETDVSLPRPWCADWVGNSASDGGYGPLACTPGASLVLMLLSSLNATEGNGTRVDGDRVDLLWPSLASGSVPTTVVGSSPPRISQHRSGAELRGIVVVLVDAFHQVVTTETGLLLSAHIVPPAGEAASDEGQREEAEGQQEAESSSGDSVGQPQLLGQLVNSLVNGIAVMEGIHLTAKQGVVHIGFESSGLGSLAQVEVSTRRCAVGEVNVSDACEPCTSPLFSWDPHNESCDPCPPNAACYGGGLVVPLAGYWQPAANSYSVHACPRHGACAYKRRADVISASKLAGGEWDADVQCSPGYRGVLCAQCAPGYGRSSGFRCDRCPRVRVAIGVYCLMALLSTSVVVYIVHSALRMSQGGEGVEDYMLGSLAKIFVSWLQILGMLSQVREGRQQSMGGR
eukprot:jgi/Mesvir1/26668/Mv20452-RA.1